MNQMKVAYRSFLPDRQQPDSAVTIVNASRDFVFRKHSQFMAQRKGAVPYKVRNMALRLAESS